MAWPGVRNAQNIAPGYYPIQYTVIDEDLEYPYISEAMALLDKGYSPSQIYYRFGIKKRTLQKYKDVFESINAPLNHTISKFPDGVWINDIIEIKTESGYKFGKIVGIYPNHIWIMSKDGGIYFTADHDVSTDEIKDIDYSHQRAYFNRYNAYIKSGFADIPRWLFKPSYDGIRYVLSRDYNFPF